MSLLRTAAVRGLLSLVCLGLAPLASADGKAPVPSKPAAPAKPAAPSQPAAPAKPVAPSQPAAQLFPAAQLRAPEIFWTVLLFHPHLPVGDVVGGGRKLQAAKYPQLNPAAVAGKPRPEAIIERARDEDLSPIDADLLPYVAQNLTPEEQKLLLNAREATVLSFRVPFAQRYETLQAAMRFAQQLASEHGAILWDTETREYFSAQSWKELRLDGWTAGAPFVPAHITFHFYRDGEGFRLISLGMAKFGLPDLVVEQVPQALSSEMGRLANSVAQLLAEGMGLSPDGTLEVNLSKLKDARLAGQLQERVQKGAQQRVKLQALQARRDGGDPDNPLLELGFPGEGALHARQVEALDTLFGKQPDAITRVAPEDAELEAVARKARARLEELRARVDRGLRPPEQLLLKAGFRTDRGGLEFMWFEASSWEAGKWRGTLANEPDDVSSLRMGSSVAVPAAEVVDYLYMSPSGAREGGESSQILMRRQGM